MRMTSYFGKTLREEPTEVETASHRLLLKSGMIRQVASGVYSYLPLAWRSLRNIEDIIRQEMDHVDGQEVRMPALQPLELWQESGRSENFGEALFALKDRRQRSLVLAPTHEEVFTIIANANIQSYRDLPRILYQIQTKFRDEARPRGGLLRVREFDMKDAYSFDIDEEGLAKNYDAIVQAYKNIFSRCGLPALQVEADSGAIGGKDSHEFLLPTDSGEDLMLFCPGCGYAANSEKAESVKPGREKETHRPLSEVHTPGITTIEDLATLLEIPKSSILKAVFYSCDGQMVFVTIRGDLDVNECKLKNLLRCKELRLATDTEIESAGLVAGSASAISLKGVRVVADDSIKLGSNFVVGANRSDYHIRNANCPRDFVPDVMADIAMAQSGHACRRCGVSLESKKGIEVGHVFKLGTVFSERLNANFLDHNGVQRPMVMGSYGIGVGRLLAAVIEQNHDERGMVVPTSVAPYQVQLVALNVENSQVAQTAENLYHMLEQSGLEVFYDDRNETAGVKLNDADLLGFPVRVLVSPRNLSNGVAEVKRRQEDDTHLVLLEEVVEKSKSLLGLTVS